MLFNSGTGTGNGTRQRIEVGFKPFAVWIKCDTTQFLAYHNHHMWVERSNALGAQSSFQNGIRVVDTGFYIGTDAKVNSSGVAFHWMCIGEDDSEDFEIQSYMGNATNGRTLNLINKRTPIAALIKRDSNKPAVFKIGSNPCIFMDGTTPSECIALTGPGLVTLTNAIQVNEYDSAGGLGEAIEGLFFFGNSPNCKMIVWSGNGVAGRVIPTRINASGILIARPEASSSRMITNTMAGKSAPCSAAAMQSNEASLSAGNLVIGSNPTPLNAVGSTYGAIVFEKKLNGAIKAPVFQIKNKQAVFLPARGVASYVTCGTSDATLLITGAISIEWFGAIWHDPGAAVTNDCPIICRGVGPYGSTNTYSWGLHGQQPNDGSLVWCGMQYEVQKSQYLAGGVPLDIGVWRTGIIAPFGQFQHIVSTDDGAGNLRLYANGKLVKQLQNPVVSIVSQSGHETTIGARVSGGGYVRNNRMMVRQAGVYSRALTADEVTTLYERAALGSTIADVTTGLAERWSADIASSAAMPAAVNSANNGTINLGSVVQL